MALDSLFRRFELGSLTLSNRLVMAPMTRRLSPNGIPGPDVAAYYRRRAEGGTGLIITEGTGIADPAALAEANIPEFHGEHALAGWRNVCEQVHAVGGRIFPQLWHVGGVRRAHLTTTPEVPAVSPSGLFGPADPNGDVLTTARIDAIIEAYGQAAVNAKAIGFDGIELHFAHGYLADQFLWGATNLRDDRYGEARDLFGLEVVAECRNRVGPDFPISMRFSQWKQQAYEARLFDTPTALARFLEPMAAAGVDIFHCSTRRFWVPEFEGSRMNLAGWTKRLSGKSVITVGSVGLDEEFLVTRVGPNPEADSSHMDLLEDMLATGEVDLVAVGRALLADPLWGRKLEQGSLDQVHGFTRTALTTLD